MDMPSSPSKRARVTFDTDVEVLSADDDDDLNPLVIKEQVRRAIQRHILDDDDAYERVRLIFSTSADKQGAPSSKALKLYLQAVLANVSQLTRDCSSLVHAVLNSEWIGRDETYFTLFVKFLGNLAAAQSGYVNKIMQVLVDLLGPQKTRRLPNSKPIRRSKIYRRTLQTVQYITQLVPTASGSLADRIVVKLDFDFEKADDRMTYITNFIELIKYVPELTSEILTNILRQLIKLDTAVQADLDDQDEEVEDEILQHMSASQTLAMAAGQDMLRGGLSSDEEDDFATSEDSESDEEDELDPLALRRRKLKEDVKQVDMVMDMLFQYYSRLTNSTTLQVRHNAIEQLIAQFHSLILPTYRSRHPQFLIFHFAQSDPIIVDRFVTSCVAVLIDKKQPQVLRHAAAAYFSGFVGRGAHVSPSVVQACIDLLCDQLSMLRKIYEPACHGPDLKRYGDFYSIFQAIMYIFCFRWRDIGSPMSDIDDEFDLLEGEDSNERELQFPENLREALNAAIHSPLNPLRVCTPAIVEQFAKITMSVQFLYIYSKIEENRRVRIAPARFLPSTDIDINQVDRDLSWVGDNGMLEGYFPYDPYHLPISRHWIENDYVEWQGLPGEPEESDSDEEDTVTTDVYDSDDEVDENAMDSDY